MFARSTASLTRGLERLAKKLDRNAERHAVRSERLGAKITKAENKALAARKERRRSMTVRDNINAMILSDGA